MNNPQTAAIALASIITCLAACANDRIVQPVQDAAKPVGVLTRIEVPSTLRLLPGLTTAIPIKAYDERDRELAFTKANATYASSDTTVVRIDGGIVSAVAPGSAEIRTTVTLNAVAVTGVTGVAVGVTPAPGTYLFTGTILGSSWGDTTCCTVTGILSVQLQDGLLAGTYSKLGVIHADGSKEDWGDGLVSSDNYHGQLMFTLHSPTFYLFGYINTIEATQYIGFFEVGDGLLTGNFTLTHVSPD